ncbi:MAG TPA: rRNA adenine N-6-methyltransferase family protein [Gaiellaceae bacterium]|nr:rRNA adenine N-6-methyltransferase family protein [Gaiellaceae bacterium]
MAGRRAQARPPLPRSRHFLRSRALAAAIVAGADISPRDLAVDIGAGSGRLTAELATVAQRVVAIELDPRLAAGLRGRWPNVHVVTGDALLVPLPDEPFRVVANIPFAYTSELLHRLLDDPRLPLVRADLIVEWGVAVKRGLPAPSSVSGVLWGAFHELRVERKLPAAVFDPPPACDAGVLVATRRTRPLIAPDELPAYRRFVADAFRGGRRVGGALPRDLDAHQWAERFRRV